MVTYDSLPRAGRLFSGSIEFPFVNRIENDRGMDLQRSAEAEIFINVDPALPPLNAADEGLVLTIRDGEFRLGHAEFVTPGNERLDNLDVGNLER